MKKCSECNCDMIDDCKIKGQLSFEVGMNGVSRISIEIPTGEMKKSIFGFQYNEMDIHELKARVCPECGKTELYIDIKKQ